MGPMNRGCASGAGCSVAVVPDDLVIVDDVSRRLSHAVGHVVLVTAPAGYGKTSQVAAWVDSDGRPVAWTTLDRCCNDPGRLLTMLLDMLRQVGGVDPDEFARRWLRSEQSESEQLGSEQAVAVVASALGHVVHDCTNPFVFVFDDAHTVDDARATSLLQAVLDHVPPDSTVVLIARSSPPEALARIRSYSGVVDVSMDDLALDVDGAQRLLASAGLVAADEVIEQLVERTEGCPVALRMAAVTSGSSGPSGTVDANPVRWPIGPGHPIDDFVREEWLRGMSTPAIEFLTLASCLDVMTAPMCDEVFERDDSGAILERLRESTMLLVPLDHPRDAYRMHRLLREVVHDHLERHDPSLRRRIHRRASAWFERDHDADGAIRHAVLAGDRDRVVRLVVDHAPGHQALGAHATVQRWLDAIPTEVKVSNPSLCLAASSTSLNLGDSAAADQWLRFAEHAVTNHARSSEESLLFESHRNLLSRHPGPRALADSRHAYAYLPPGLSHARACLGYGVLSFMVGDDETAMRSLVEGSAEARLVGAVSVEAKCLANQAAVLVASNDRARAVALARSARALQRDHRLDELPSLVMVTSMSALVEAMSGDPDLSRADAALSQRSLAVLAPLAGWARIQARLTLAETYLLLGESMTAQTLLDEVAPMLRDNPAAVRPIEQFDRLTTHMRAGRVELPQGASSLTTAELRLVPYLPTNLTLAAIADRIFVSRNTAKSHAAAIYRKLGVSSRGEAVDVARSVGLLPSDAVSPIDDRPQHSHRDELPEHVPVVGTAVR